MMMDDTTNMKAGDTLNVTIKVEGHEPMDGTLTVTSVEDDHRAYVENADGVQMRVTFQPMHFESNDVEVPQLFKRDQHKADLTALEVA